MLEKVIFFLDYFPQTGRDLVHPQQPVKVQSNNQYAVVEVVKTLMGAYVIVLLNSTP